MRYEQYPDDNRMRDPEFAKKWRDGYFAYMSEREEEEWLLSFGTRKERKAIKARRKAREQAKQQGK